MLLAALLPLAAAGADEVPLDIFVNQGGEQRESGNSLSSFGGAGSQKRTVDFVLKLHDAGWTT